MRNPPSRSARGNFVSISLRDAQGAKSLIESFDWTIAWYGETHVLCRGIERLIDNFVVLPTTPAGQALCDSAGYRRSDLMTLLARSPKGHAVGVLAFEPDPDLAATFPAHARFLSPRPEVISTVGDKTLLPAILAESGAPGVPGVTLESSCKRDAGRVWDALRCDRLVVQLPENNKIGKGTFVASSRQDLDEILERHTGNKLRVSSFIAGDVITTSACAHRHGTVISYFSKQLNGMPELTPHWASHCGNEVFPAGRYGPAAIENFRSITERVGRVLRQHGFLGIFGLDLLVDERGRSHVVEINPRLHSIGSLINAYEVERGRFPILAHHILTFLGADLSGAPRLSDEEDTGCPYTQLVLLNLGPQITVSGTLASGSYELERDSRLRLVRAGADLLDLQNPDEFLLTIRVVEGDELKNGQRIADIQRRGPMVDDDGKLRREVTTLIASIKTALGAS